MIIEYFFRQSKVSDSGYIADKSCCAQQMFLKELEKGGVSYMNISLHSKKVSFKEI